MTRRTNNLYSSHIPEATLDVRQGDVSNGTGADGSGLIWLDQVQRTRHNSWLLNKDEDHLFNVRVK